MTGRPLSTIVALLCSAAPATASTWIVDDDGGPGVDFTTIAAAEAAAVAGDVILVRAGSYAGFTLDVAAAILGEPGATITSVVVVQGIPAGSRATLAGFTTRGIRVAACDAPVVLEDLLVQASVAADLGNPNALIAIAGSPDVRLRGVNAAPGVQGTFGSPIHAVTVANARAELSQCVSHGARGRSCVNYVYEAPAAAGGDGVQASSGIVRLGGSSVRGGDGGSTQPGAGLCANWDANDGGAGLRLLGSASCIVSGVPSNLVEGGYQGVGNDCVEDGEPGSGVVIAASASLRYSGATAVGQSYYPGCGGSAPAISGAYTQPPVPDPILTFSGTPQPGNAFTYTVRGEPGARAFLRIGRQLVVVDDPQAAEDLLLVPLRTYDLGILPAGGAASFTLNLPASLPRGLLIVAQGRVESPGGGLALTHSLPITLR